MLPEKQNKAYTDFYNSTKDNGILNSKTTLFDPTGHVVGHRLLSLDGLLPWHGQGAKSVPERNRSCFFYCYGRFRRSGTGPVPRSSRPNQ